ncbi:hypothetical protein, partial [Brevibacillus reuszeri]|uniref:hypothetical protein n=1 Tax=Brevibacillus reuszeri TaxID=54915 RepID=UPI001BB3352D
ASVRPEPGSNSPIKFVTGSKLANHLMIDSLTLSLFSFQRAFCVTPSPRDDFFNLPHLYSENQVVFSFLCRHFFDCAAATFVNIAWIKTRSQQYLKKFTPTI